MRKLIALKTMLRTPVKTLLTCLLIAAATFALFSKPSCPTFGTTINETVQAIGY